MEHGDSGSPVWNAHTGRVIGIIGGGKPLGHEPGAGAWVVPLAYNPRLGIEAPGILLALSEQVGPLTVDH